MRIGSRFNSIGGKVEDVAYELESIVGEIETLENENEELKEYIDELERNKPIFDGTVYGKIKEEFLTEVSKIYSLEELEVIFQKKQGYPLTKII